MNEPVPLGNILQGYCAKLLAPHAPRAVIDPTRLGVPRQPLNRLIRQSVLARDGYQCVWCFASSDSRQRVLFEVDHIVPWIAGGSDHPVNLRTLCRDCNQERGSRVTDLDRRALPIVWRCYSCDHWGDVEQGGPSLITAYCSTCKQHRDNVPYIADLMMGGQVPKAGIPAFQEGDQDYYCSDISVTTRAPERRFKDSRERDDRLRADLARRAARSSTRAEARAELDAIRPTPGDGTAHDYDGLPPWCADTNPNGDDR